jgi:hypothetical protein
MGSLYKGSTTDAEGKPLVIKNGANAGQPRTNFFFAVAIPKGAETHWAETPWGAIIWGVGHKAFPQAAQSPSFAWKIENGDSTVPNKRGRKPCDNEGWKGHWILKFSGGFAPKVYRPDASGMVQVMESDYVLPGDFIEVAGTVDGNGSQSQPGIYLNHSMICARGYSTQGRISFGPDANEAGFGQSALPAGASMTPTASTVPMPAAAPVTGVPAAPLPTATVAAPPPIPVSPNPQFLQVPPNPSSPAAIPAIPASPAVAAAPPAPPPPAIASPSSGPTMTAKAAGASYQAYLSAGWTDAALIANGYMTI